MLSPSFITPPAPQSQVLQLASLNKKIFFNASYAHYDDCLAGKLRLIPTKDDLLGLQSDYEKMHAVGMLSSDTPDFEVLTERLQAIENQVNCRT